MSVLLSTAYLDEAERCDEIVLLHEGRVLERGDPRAMSARWRGRTYLASAPGMRGRDLQDALRAQPGVLDAVVQGDRVRLVTTAEFSAPVADIRPVEPRFEDSFVARLREDRGERAARPGFAPPPAPAAPPAGDVVIEVRGLRRRFGGFYAVDGVSFEVRRGEVFGLLGANGAGKSTTFRMLCGLLPASGGTLRVAGVDLRRAAAAARSRIGYMSQKFSLYANLSLRQNLEFFAGVYGLPAAEREARIGQALGEFELGPFAGQLSGEMSLGHKQRLAMACALLHRPEILFLDEPTSGVDPLARREFWQRITRLSRQGVTILVTTHFMEEAEYCDRVAIMAAGRILALGEPAAIKREARQDGTAEPSLEDAFVRLIENAARAEAPA